MAAPHPVTVKLAPDTTPDAPALITAIEAAF